MRTHLIEISTVGRFTSLDIWHFENIGTITDEAFDRDWTNATTHKLIIKWNASEYCLGIPSRAFIHRIEKIGDGIIGAEFSHDGTEAGSVIRERMRVYSIEPRGQFNVNFTDFLCELRDEMRLSNVAHIMTPPQRLESSARAIVDHIRDTIIITADANGIYRAVTLNDDTNLCGVLRSSEDEDQSLEDVYKARSNQAPLKPANPKCSFGHEVDYFSLPKTDQNFYFGRCKVSECKGFVKAFSALTNSDSHGANQSNEQTANP